MFSGNHDVYLYGANLTEDVMRHAQVIVDVFTVPPHNWSVVAGNWPSVAPRATHCLRVRVPPMPAGEVWIEVETMHTGRLLCPEAFIYRDDLQFSMRGTGIRGVVCDGALGDSNAVAAKATPSLSSAFVDFTFNQEFGLLPSPTSPTKNGIPGQLRPHIPICSYTKWDLELIGCMTRGWRIFFISKDVTAVLHRDLNCFFLVDCSGVVSCPKL